MSDTSRSRLKVSREGIVLIKSFAGFRPRAVRNESGGWVIGYGHTASAREGLTVGEQDAELLLQYDLLPVVKALNEQVSAPLNQHQFDALASFAVSVGVERFLASDVFQRLNAGYAGEAADALIGWPEPPAPDRALRRRSAERALFVADPNAPVHLADLLAAPLPSPQVPPPPPAPDARAAAVAALLGEAPVSSGHSPTIDVPPAISGFTGPSPQEASFPPPAQALLHQRFVPHATVVSGPLPGFPPRPDAEGVDEPAEATIQGEADPESDDREPGAAAATAGATEVETSHASSDTPVSATVPPPPDEAIVRSPSVEAAPAKSPLPDPVSDQRSADDADETPLFGDEAPLSVLRHETEPTAPRRFDWSETGAFLIMGLVGLAACAASAASFRKAMTEDSFIGDFTIIGWVLALIGLICVGVSSWNLYRRWGRRD